LAHAQAAAAAAAVVVVVVDAEADRVEVGVERIPSVHPRTFHPPSCHLQTWGSQRCQT
jgi:hypothetical protein